MSASTSDLSAFFQHLRLNNPFDDNRITRTDVVPDSVDTIHRGAWDELLLQTQRASAGTNARSVVITGPPGIGKSHLLARFREWAVAERHPFVYLLNLQSGPRDLLRSIVRTTLQSLSRDLNRTPFQCRLFKIVHGAVTVAGQRFAPGEELSLPRAERLYLRLVDEHGLPRGPARVLWAFFEDIYRLNFNQPLSHTHQLALQWLSGDALDPEHARELQLFTATADEGVAASNEELREILQLLCRFAAFRGRCLILAFDQIDTLSEEQVRAWSAAAHGLLDLCPGLMLVCSGVDSTLFQWTQRGWVSRASWDDRIRQFSISLAGIHALEARQMVRRRLQRSLAAFAELPDIAAAITHDPDFPLGQIWLQQELADPDGTPRADLRPRDVMNLAARRWELCYREASAIGAECWLHQRQLGDALPQIKTPPEHNLPVLADVTVSTAEPQPQGLDRILAERLEHQRQLRADAQDTLPVDPGNLLGMLQKLLRLCQHAPEPWRTSRYAELLDCNETSRSGTGPVTFQLCVQHFERSTGRRQRIGLAVPENTSATSATALLRRMLNKLQQESTVDRAVLLTDARRPLNPGRQGLDYLADLKSLRERFTLHQLSFADYTMLDATTHLIGAAGAGELFLVPDGESGRAVSEQEVVEWLHRTDRLMSIPILQLLTQPPQNV